MLSLTGRDHELRAHLCLGSAATDSFRVPLAHPEALRLHAAIPKILRRINLDLNRLRLQHLPICSNASIIWRA